MRSHILGLFLGLIIIYSSVLMTAENQDTYFDRVSFLIVFGGTLSVAIMTNGIKDSIKSFGVFFKIFSSQKYTTQKVINELLEVAQKNYNNEKLNTHYHPFIIDGMRLIENKFSTDQIEKIMLNSIIERKETQDKTVERFETLAKYPPAFGMMGTIIGLVSVLKQINNPENMGTIGPAMALALVTTLYGIFLSNYILQPIGDNLSARNYNDIKTRQLITEAIILMSGNNDPIYIREVLFSYVSPTDREAFKNLKRSILKEAA